MSRIYFHSEYAGTAEVRGSERAWMSCLCNDIALGVIGPNLTEQWLINMFPTSHYVRATTSTHLAQAVRLALRMFDLRLNVWRGEHEAWLINLNTCIAIGAEPLRLFARLHAQCEVHCYIEGAPDKTWLAYVIENGLLSGVIRKNQGWESVVTLLRIPKAFPVVCSYSVCDGFPSPGCMPEGTISPESEDEWEEFGKLDLAKQWSLGMENLSRDPDLRITRSDDLRTTFGQWNWLNIPRTGAT